MGRLVFNEEYAETVYAFRDREDAGAKLATWLRALGVRAGVVYAIPAGGVPVAYGVAEALGSKLDVLVCRKLLIPWNREVGFGAVAPDGTFFYDPLHAAHLGLTARDIVSAIEEQLSEVKRRLERYRCNEPYQELAGISALVVDDGIAAGYTMKATAKFLRKQGASRVVVAVPTCHAGSALALAREVDELYCMNPRSTPLYAVADAYAEWRDLEDEDVLRVLKSAREKGMLAYKGACICSPAKSERATPLS